MIIILVNYNNNLSIIILFFACEFLSPCYHAEQQFHLLICILIGSFVIGKIIINP